MYWGSVKFFKHLIIGTLVLIVLSLLLLGFNILRFTVFAQFNEADDVPGHAQLSAHDHDDNLAGIHNGGETAEDPAPLDSPPLHAAVHETETPVPALLPTDPENKPYQLLLPHLFCAKPDETTAEDKTVYLTFDDGPSRLTGDVLDILKRNNVKATFFLIGKTDELSKTMIKRIADEGHTIGIHTYTHDYKQIYASVDAYLEDFNRIYSLIYETTGITANIFRFPGGSVNAYNKTLSKDLIEEMTRRGFTYYDWNVDAVDTASGATEASITKTVVGQVLSNTRSIVLFHNSDWQKKTVSALDGIIRTLREKGYVFDRLTNKVKPIVFKLN